MAGGLKVGFFALASIVALAAPSTVVGSAKAQESATWYCYVAAEVQGYKGVVIGPVFEWYGVGRPPQNVMASQFREYSASLMPSALWPMSLCFKERGKTEDSRSNTISNHNRSGGTILQQYYVYEGH